MKCFILTEKMAEFRGFFVCEKNCIESSEYGNCIPENDQWLKNRKTVYPVVKKTYLLRETKIYVTKLTFQ